MTVKDARIPMVCPECEKPFWWSLSPDEQRQWANALDAHLDGLPVLDTRIFDGVRGDG